MKTSVRAALSAATVLFLGLIANITVQAQGRIVIQDRFADVDGVVIKGSGHWLMEEAPSQVIPELLAFVNKSH